MTREYFDVSDHRLYMYAGLGGKLGALKHSSKNQKHKSTFYKTMPMASSLSVFKYYNPDNYKQNTSRDTPVHSRRTALMSAREVERRRQAIKPRPRPRPALPVTHTRHLPMDAFKTWHTAK